MSVDPAHLEHARKVADAILYEGYLLYPYRQSAAKNQARFQFGVLMPPAYREADPSEPSASQTECLLECPDGAEVQVLARFLHWQHRSVQATPAGGQPREVPSLTAGDSEFTTWDEARPREQQLSVAAGGLGDQPRAASFHIPSGTETGEVTGPDGQPAGRLVRRWQALDGRIEVSGERVAGPYRALRLRVRVENRTQPQPPPRRRDDALPAALIATHLLIGVSDGAFISLTDPPEWAAAEASACRNVGAWPVLAGPPDCRNLLLSAPVILYDHPEIAPESAGDLFDATEIDEILTLRTLALTDAEKREARATDPRASEILDRLDGLPPELLERMHGAIRYLRPAAPAPEPPGGAQVPPLPGGPRGPWWDPGSDTSVSPETDQVVIAGVRVARGAVVTMRPGSRRADAQDLFLAGRPAVVEAVLHDVDGQVHVAVRPSGAPAADLHASHGRFLYFAPDELEPLDPPAGAAGQPGRKKGT